jgi:DNA-binding NtrC family response regulator
MFHPPTGVSSAATALAPMPRAATRPGATDIVLISPYELDKWVLQQAISHKWNVLHVHTCEEALALIAYILVPVVICDQEVGGRHWKEAIKTILTSPHPAPVILATDVYDWHLWVDTIDNGGFELLARPFRDAEDKLYSAVRHWKEGRIRRTWDQFFRR